MSYCLRILAAGCLGAGVTLAYPAFAQKQDQQQPNSANQNSSRMQGQGTSAGSYQGKRPTGGFHPTAGSGSYPTSGTGGGAGRGKHEAEID
jgi:hypothetical protein